MTVDLAPLWPSADSAAPSRSHGFPYVVLPSPTDPRLVLPARPHRAAATILRSLRDASSFRAKIRSSAVRAMLLTRARTRPLPSPSLLDAVSALLPAEDYVCGAHLGPARANRKPVLAIATVDGELVAFAKWGMNPLTDRLVLEEAAALPRLVELRTVDAPRLLGVVEHEGHPAVVQSPVPRSRRTPVAESVIRAQVEVASIGVESIDPQAALEAVGVRWRERLKNAPDEVVEEFASFASRWVVEAANADLPWGSWHGDWRRTNMDASPAGCAVWDWERFAAGVPMGYDALHLFLTSHAASLSDLGALPTAVEHNAARLLSPFGVAPTSVELVTRGYLLELAGRYLDDRQSATGARLGAVDQWLLPYLRSTKGEHRTRGTSV